MNVPAPADENGTPDPNKPTDAEIQAAFRRAFLEIYGMTPKRLMTMLGIDEKPIDDKDATTNPKTSQADGRPN